MLKFAKLARSTYYYFITQNNTPDKYSEIKGIMVAAFAESKQTYGYMRILSVLHTLNYTINHKTVNKLMRKLGLKVKVRRAKYKSYKGEVGKIAPNILNRDFKATAPTKNW